ncbi:hypothetical protein J4E91_005996 [Alternaria rosae]|nr:hypothetical protein J4E91_005996 [Alternaria rosae]
MAAQEVSNIKRNFLIIVLITVAFQRYMVQKSLLEEEPCKEARKDWKPRVFIQDYRGHRKRIAEEQKNVRRTQWEKFKGKMGL